jgi:hypothetical protein
MVTDGEQADFFPNWSPDGRRLAFVRDGEVWIVEVDSAPEARRVTEGAQATLARWESGGRTILASGTWGTNQKQLRRVSIEGVGAVPLEPPVVFGDTTATGLFGLSGDGGVIAYIDSANVGDLWLMEDAPGDG